MVVLRIGALTTRLTATDWGLLVTAVAPEATVTEALYVPAERLPAIAENVMVAGAVVPVSAVDNHPLV
jgi:hypothetical protein